jgi:mono/diheme cytochrome c family protein
MNSKNRNIDVVRMAAQVLVALGGLGLASGCSEGAGLAQGTYPEQVATGGTGGAVLTGGTGGQAGGSAGVGVGPDQSGAGGSGGSPLQPGDAALPMDDDPWASGIEIEHQDQKPGDPQAGYDYLINAGYFGCGVPARFFGVVSPFATLPGIPNEPLPGRNVSVGGAPLAYNWNLDKNADGLDVVYMNCLQCHAGKFNGKLIIGLGNADADWTVNLGGAAGAAGLLGILGPLPVEQRELDKFIGRLEVIGTPAVMKTVGTNPAEMLATTFVSHRDRHTLAWSREALLHIPALDESPPGTIITSKTPPWWRMAKKASQFYNGMGRGDHRRSMMLAGSLCTDTVEQAEAIDVHFNDVSAYIYSIQPPKWPFGVDQSLATQGHQVFAESCAGCHGSYAPDAPGYPNLLIPAAEIGTDPAVGLGGTSEEYGSALVDWYNESWYGEVGPYEPFSGYVAPPLDAVWATAPYLHNGSVPDVATLLDSSKRPTYWRRVDHDTTNYDETRLGFPWVELPSGHTAPPFGVAAKDIYDTTQYSHTNTGHTYGDALTDAERRAVIEYLKTL